MKYWEWDDEGGIKIFHFLLANSIYFKSELVEFKDTVS